MCVDEKVYYEVVCGFVVWGCCCLFGLFCVVVFGVNDGLVSNFVLVFGIGVMGVSLGFVFFSGIVGLFVGVFLMGVGEFVLV